MDSKHFINCPPLLSEDFAPQSDHLATKSANISPLNKIKLNKLLSLPLIPKTEATPNSNRRTKPRVFKKEQTVVYEELCVMGRGFQGSALKVQLLGESASEIFCAKTSFQTDDDEKKSTLEKEFQFISRLDHPNLIKAKDYFTCSQSGEPVFITEFFNGVTLEEFIEEKVEDISENDFLLIAKQILSVINYLHQKNVCHRDISLSNILIDKNNLAIKLIDFGLSIDTEFKENLLTPTGLKECRAPEMLTLDEYNNKVDEWMAGLVLLKLATRNLSWTTKKVLKEKKEQSSSLFESLLSSQAQLIGSLLVVEPEQRLSAELCLKNWK